MPTLHVKHVSNQQRMWHLACGGIAGLACLVRSIAARSTTLVCQLASRLVGLPPSLANAICCGDACLLCALLRL
jgi:hypothetical protein